MDGTDPSNYPSTCTISTEHFDIIIDRIQVSIDRIVLTCIYVAVGSIDMLLKMHGKVLSDTGTEYKSGYIDLSRRIRTYLIHGKTLTVYYRNDKYHNKKDRQQIRMIIDEPTVWIIIELAGIFKQLNATAKISKIEIAWDFYTKHIYFLQEWMEQHLWLYYNRKSFWYAGDTYYVSDLRQSVKGIRLYSRPKWSTVKKYIRMELELHRPTIRKLGITFPLTIDQLPLELTKYLRFCGIDYDGLKRSNLRLHKVDRDRTNFKATHPIRRHPKRLLQQQLISEVDAIGRNDSLVKRMELVKGLGVSNHTRFLTPLKEMDWIINELPHAQGFNYGTC